MSEHFDVATAPHQNSKYWAQGSVTWGELVGWVENPADHRECGNYVLGRLNGKTRSKKTIASRSVLVLDADSVKPELLGRVKDLSYQTIAHTTWSSTIDEPRYRLLVRPDRDLTPDEYRHVVQALMEELGIESFDLGSSQPERYMFKPSTRGAYEHWVFDGPPLPVGEYLSRLVESVEPRAAATGTTAPKRPQTDLEARYEKAAVGGELARLDGMPGTWAPGDYWDNTTFAVACNLIEFANADWTLLTLDEAEGLLLDHAPSDRVWNKAPEKWASALKTVGDKARLAPKPNESTAEEDFAEPLPEEDFAEPLPAETPVKESSFEIDVAREAHWLRVREEARRRIDLERRPAPKPWDAGTLAEQLLKPEPPPGRVESLIPWAASTALVAQRKTAKTTFALNLAWSLLTGEPFLEKFMVAQINGRVAMLNFEVSGHTVAGWAKDIGIPAERLFIVNLRGAANPFAYPDRLAELAELLKAQNVETLIVDPFGRAFTGDSQNEAGQVQAWLLQLDTFARDAVGALDVVLTVHAGWNGERARGSSALEDWADSLIYLTRDEDTDERFIRADGRDVTLEEDQLRFDPVTRHLSLSGKGSRKQTKAARKQDDLILAVVPIVEESPGIKTGDIEAELRNNGFPLQKGDGARAAASAAAQGLIRREPGPRNSWLHYPIGSSHPESPRVTPGVTCESPPSPPKGGGTHWGDLEVESPRTPTRKEG